MILLLLPLKFISLYHSNIQMQTWEISFQTEIIKPTLKVNNCHADVMCLQHVWAVGAVEKKIRNFILDSVGDLTVNLRLVQFEQLFHWLNNIHMSTTIPSSSQRGVQSWPISMISMIRFRSQCRVAPTSSHWITGVKQPRAGLVLGWVTSEYVRQAQRLKLTPNAVDA